jgi:dipeptidyl aminopeptidase/acylaminoacyl peptidase
MSSRALSTLCCILLATTLRAQQRPAHPTSVALSPDGALVAWTLTDHDITTLHLSNALHPDVAKEQLITVGSNTECSNESPFWSPDSQTLAFLSTCTAGKTKPSQQQVFLWSRSSAKSTQLTHLTGNLEQPVFSPDSKSIAFLFVENATRQAGALDAMKPFAGVIGEDGVEIQRIYGVSIASGAGRWISPPSLHVYEFSYNPAKPEVTYIAANPPGENTWWIARLYTQSLFTVDTLKPRILLDPTTVPGSLHGLQIAVPRFSPDGKTIAVIGGLMSDQGSTGGDIYTIPTDAAPNTEPTDVTPDIDGTPTFFAWITPTRIGLVEDRRGHISFPDWDVTRRAYIPGSTVDIGEVSIFGGPIKDAVTFSPTTSTLAFIMSGVNRAAEVFLLPPSGLTQFTHLNDNTPRSTIRVESIEWTSPVSPTDPTLFHVQGWLTYPQNFDPHKKYPMIVQVHGGPSASAGPPRRHEFADLGYFEFEPNPRGSFGQGEAFVQANRKDFGYGDLRDILAGVDSIEKTLPIDDHRLGLTGWSYGGFMTMFAVTQTHRFRAAVAGAGISDWLSYYGENSIDQWMTPFFGASVYDDPAVYARSSAITFIKNVTTPTLVIVGDRDGECPAPQSFEFWHALRAEGVKTQLVVYPNEGHGFRDPAHIKDRAARTAQWFADNMPAGKD